MPTTHPVAQRLIPLMKSDLPGGTRIPPRRKLEVVL